jgi:hypothetical protein
VKFLTERFIKDRAATCSAEGRKRIEIGTHVPRGGLLHLRVFGFGVPEDGNVRVSVVPQREKILGCCAGSATEPFDDAVAPDGVADH